MQRLLLPIRRYTTPTVDGDEVTRFKKLALGWWEINGSMRPLHSLNKLRIPFIREGLISSGAVKNEYINTPYPLKDLSIIDIGCGAGIVTEALARLGSITTGLDATPDLIEVAKLHASTDPSLKNLNYVTTLIETFCEQNFEKYDAVVASEVIEHVGNTNLFIEACVKCLKPGGSIFMTTLDRTCASWVGAIILAENIFQIVPKGTHDWNKFVAPHELQRMLEDNNCVTKKIHGMVYNTFTNDWHWIDYHGINYALHAVKQVK